MDGSRSFVPARTAGGDARSHVLGWAAGGVLLAAVGWLVADLRVGILFGLILAAAFLLTVAVERAVLYLLPAVLVVPNLGLDLPGPFAVLVWDAFTVGFAGGALLRRLVFRRPFLDADPWFRRFYVLFVATAMFSLGQLTDHDPALLLFGFKEFVRLIEVGVLLFVLAAVLDSEEKIALLHRNLVLVGAASLAVALAAHFWITDPFYRLMGLEKAYVLLGTYRLRMISTAGNVAETGMYLLMMLGLSTHFVLHGPLRTRLLASLLGLGLAAGIILTFNKGTWQAALLGLLVFLVRVRTRRRELLLGVLLVAFAGLVLLYQSDRLAPAGAIANDLVAVSRSSGAVRVERWISSLNVLREHPILGVGYNTFAYQYGEYSILPGAGPQYGHPHNLFVDVMTGTGLVGITLFLLALWRLVRASARNTVLAPEGGLRHLSGHLHLVLWFFLGGNLTTSFFFKPNHPAFLFATVAAMILAARRITTRPPAKPVGRAMDGAPETG